MVRNGMSDNPPCRPHRAFWYPLPIVAGLAAALLSGCQSDEITTYTVPRAEKVQQDVRQQERPMVRLLAAILPYKDRTWFFKLLGPVPAVNEQEKAFEAFIQSVRFSDDAKKPIAWQLPEGWREEAGKGMRYATIRLGAKDAPMELTVFAFGEESGSLLTNVNRWRKLDLKLPDIGQADLGEVTRE